VGDPDQRLVRPYSVDVDGQLIVVSDPGMNAIHIYDLNKSRYRRISTFDDRQLQTPVGVAIAAENIIVADSSLGNVLVFNHEGQLIREIKGLQRPTGLAWHEESGLLYVADTLAHEIVVFDQDGERAFSFGNRGTGPGQLNYPTHLNLDGSKLWINDSMNFRIQAFGLDGEHLVMFGEHGDGSGFLSQPKGVGVDSDGHVYVAGATIDRVQIFSHDGRFLLSFGQPGNSPGSFTMPAGIAIDNDLIYVADSYNSRVQVFRYLGGD